MARTLGNTDLEVTPLGLGLAALGRPGYINLGHASDLAGHTDVESMERAAHAVLDAAYAGGIRYFDAARSYGLAEAFLASWLEQRGFGPDDVTVGSKWGYTYTADWHVDAKVQRGQRPVGSDARAPAGRIPRAARKPSPAVPDPLGDARQRRARRPGGHGGARPAPRQRHGDRVHVDRAASGADDRARARGRRLRFRAGDVEPARAFGRPRAGRGSRRGAGRDHQGGARQRQAHRARRRARAGGGGAHDRTDRGRARARVRAGAAVGRRRAQRRGHGGRARRATSSRESSTSAPRCSSASTRSARTPRRTGRSAASSPGTERRAGYTPCEVNFLFEERFVDVEIWSDIACPWCYIGKRRFEAALAEFEHRDDVRVTWRSFELDPSAPARARGRQRDPHRGEVRHHGRAGQGDGAAR